ncbi:GNAT family N-acetyltransferase [Archangium violaceum]|uniref:GNAT family N-acetyltransferase n=1 Tax=Archangium violaceum TaxID=83451 RepID=UPI00193B2D5D|nr:GNAT family N-acetyltransferase [Archangium violaceum]QRK05362.1 GNAT family N-acetyltransferase [Archangium violaceum]
MREREMEGETTWRGYTLRRALPEELAALPELEHLAAQQFLQSAHAFIAGAETQTLEQLREYQRLGGAWVAVPAEGGLAAFALCKEVDGTAYLAEIDVHPAHARRGLGRALFEVLKRQARERGYPAMTLITFRDIAWNAPNYERWGFRVMRDDEVGPGLRALREHETRAGFPPESRVCMLLPLDGRPDS